MPVILVVLYVDVACSPRLVVAVQHWSESDQCSTATTISVNDNVIVTA